MRTGSFCLVHVIRYYHASVCVCVCVHKFFWADETRINEPLVLWRTSNLKSFLNFWKLQPRSKSPLFSTFEKNLNPFCVGGSCFHLPACALRADLVFLMAYLQSERCLILSVFLSSPHLRMLSVLGQPSNLQPVQHFTLGLPLWCLPAGISTCPGAPRTMVMEHKGKQLQKMIDRQLSVYNHHSPVVLVKVKLSKDTLKDYSTFLKFSTMLLDFFLI